MIRWTQTAKPERYTSTLGPLTLDVYQLAPGEPWILDLRHDGKTSTRKAHAADSLDARTWALVVALPILDRLAEEATALALEVADAIARD